MLRLSTKTRIRGASCSGGMISGSGGFGRLFIMPLRPSGLIYHKYRHETCSKYYKLCARRIVLSPSKSWCDFWVRTRTRSSEAEKGLAFERLTQLYLQTTPEGKADIDQPPLCPPLNRREHLSAHSYSLALRQAELIEPRFLLICQ